MVNPDERLCLFLLGSKSEAAGGQSCVCHVNEACLLPHRAERAEGAGEQRANDKIAQLLNAVNPKASNTT